MVQSQLSPSSPGSGSRRAPWSGWLTASWWLLVASPVGLVAGALVSMGDPGTSFGLATVLAAPAAFCSVVGFVETRRWYALLPATVIAAVTLWVVGMSSRDARPQDTGIDPRSVALTVAFDDSETPECLILPPGQVVMAGDHTLLVEAPGGTTVTVVGPAPSPTAVTTYTRPDESDGVGPTVRLAPGAYTVTCALGSASSATELNVAP